MVEAYLKKFVHNGRPFEKSSLNGMPPSLFKCSKNWQSCIFAGAYNHLDMDALVKYLKKRYRQHPESLQDIYKTDFEDRFKVIDLFPEE